MFRSVPALVLLSFVLVLAGCSQETPSEVVSPEISVGDLVAEGHSPEVADCVLGLADGTAADGPSDALIDSCSRAEAMLNEPESKPVELAFAGPTAYGDDPVLDGLWDRCEAGEGMACDELWERAPVDSDYERFGVTCGERQNVLNCSELVPEGSDTDEGEVSDEE